MELQPGEEPKSTIVQPGQPQVVVDSTVKQKKPMSEERKAQLNAARNSRLAKLRAEKDARERQKALDVLAAQGVSVPTVPSSGSDPAPTPAADTTPDAVAGIDKGIKRNAPSDDGHHHSGSPASHDGGADSYHMDGPKQQEQLTQEERPAKVRKKVVTTSSTFKTFPMPITDSIALDIRTGKRKPILWSCEPLDTLVQAVIP